MLFVQKQLSKKIAGSSSRKLHKPFVTRRVVFTEIVTVSMESSIGKLYRLCFPELRFFLPNMFDPMLMKVVPFKAFPVLFLSFSISAVSFNNRAWPEVDSARSRNDGWRLSPLQLPVEMEITRKIICKSVQIVVVAEISSCRGPTLWWEACLSLPEPRGWSLIHLVGLTFPDCSPGIKWSEETTTWYYRIGLARVAKNVISLATASCVQNYDDL